MNNRVNYTFVGLLVMLGFSVIIAFSYWMLQPDSKDETQKYTVYFNESVLGLNLDAPVKYRGISVGKVSRLEINEKNSEQVQVTITVLKTTPVSVDTKAKLMSQGITGLSYINLSKGGHLSKKIACKEGEKYPVIGSETSFLQNIENSFGDVSSQLTSTLGRTQELLGSDNQEKVAQLLEHSASILTKMDKMLDDEMIQHIQNSAKNLDSLTKKMDKVIPHVDKLINNSIAWQRSIDNYFASITVSYLGITKSMDEFRRAIASGEFNLQAIGSDIVPTMNATFVQMQTLIIQLEDMMEHYNESPSDILYKSREVRKAPGETK